MRVESFASILLASVALFSSSCVSLQEKRIAKNPEAFSQLSSSDRKAVSEGNVVEGMSRDAVYLAWGRPDAVRTGSRRGKAIETWAYTRSRPASFYSPSLRYAPYYGFYSRYGVHPYRGYSRGPGWSFGSGYNFVETIDKTVEFSNGRVVAWER